MAQASGTTVLLGLEERESNLHGRGLFATRAIPGGSLIIAEPPILKITMNETQFGFDAVWRNFQLLSDQDKAMYLSLSPYGVEVDDEESFLADIKDDETKKLAKLVASIWKFHSREVCVGNIEGSCDADVCGMGLFPQQRHMNHSCTPNACLEDLDGTGVHRVVALRDLAPGEEVVWSYMPWHMLLSTKQDRANRFLFECKCVGCNASDQELSDFRRVRARKIFFGFDHCFVRNEESPEDAIAPKNFGEAIELGMECLELLEQENIFGEPRERAHHMISWSSQMADEYGAHEDNLE
ncbi:hypothetical protein F5Y16DRAFT_397341 [Xylariaceae sp. FL0255]|nr:hypothetical protein F5Y16DRAFT_397341 [Xylariaceae sp. FL0255]